MAIQIVDSRKAKDSVKSAEELIAKYTEVEPTADLTRAQECLRNAKKHLDQIHWSAAENNAQRATMSVNEAVALVLRSRIRSVIKYLRDEISRLRLDTADPLTELNDLLGQVLDLKYTFDAMDAGVLVECSKTLISALSHRVCRIEEFRNALQTLKRFDQQSRDIRLEIESIGSEFPGADPNQLNALSADLYGLGARIHAYSLDMIQAGDAKDGVYKLNRLNRRVSSYRQVLGNSPRSRKNVKQRGRDRKTS